MRRRGKEFIKTFVEMFSGANQGVSRVCACLLLVCRVDICKIGYLPVLVVQNLGRVVMLEGTLMHRWGCKVAVDEGSMKMRRLNHEEA